MKTKIFLFSLMLLCCLYNQKAAAQTSVEEAMTKKHPVCRDVFLNAIEVLPKLYKEKSFDSLQKAIDIWENACGNLPEIKYTRILLSIETASFTVPGTDSSLIELLTNYSYAYKNYTTYGFYDKSTSTYYKFSSAWAKLLLERNNLSVNEKFICNVFAGNIQQPKKEIKQHKENYPELNNLLDQDLAEQRKGPVAEYTLMAGAWSPTGNASVLGMHPSFGFQVGGKFDRHQIDLTLQFRFLKSGDSYYVKRSGNFYELDHYFGGYIGFDYNYYFVSKPKFETGIVAGIGYDGFDIADAGNNNENDYLKPFNISSLNLNTGLRINYFFDPAFYLGLQGRYNYMNYGTKGGTNLNGDSFSLDLIIGFTNKSVSAYNHYRY
ncbi:MAG: hypothetical protein ABI861_04645 [Panacibacter sp.]